MPSSCSTRAIAIPSASVSPATNRFATAFPGGVWVRDHVFGGNGIDTVYGGAQNDIVLGGNGPDWVSGGPDLDLVNGGRGDDDAFGGRGSDIVTGIIGSDVVHGGAGNDVCLDIEDGVSGNDTVFGGPGFDHFQADPGDFHHHAEDLGPCIPE